MPIELTPVEEPAADPGAAAPADGGAPAAADRPASEKPAETPAPAGSAGTPPAADPAKPAEAAKPEEGRIVELTRQRREVEGERDGLKTKVTELQGQLEQAKPLVDLLALAKDDPLQWIHEMAVASGITPERVREAIATKAAGGTVAPTVEEQLAALKRRIDEREAADQRARDDQKAADARTAEERATASNVATTGTFLKEHAKDFPLAAAGGEARAREVYRVVEERWKQLGPSAPRDQESLRALYRDAASKVEQVLRADVEALAPVLGFQRASQGAAGSAPAPQSSGGLSNELMGAAPLSDVIRDDEAIRESWLKELGN